MLSPDHAVFVEGCLIPVRLLENGATIVRETRRRSVSYFHVELDAHDILLADGLPVESYLDTGNRDSFDNGDNGPLRLHPQLEGAQDRRESSSCARLMTAATEVEPVWRRIADRARLMGFQLHPPLTTHDPRIRLIIGQQQIPPAYTDDTRCVFVLPPTDGFVRLISRATAPCDVTPWVEDRRRLGVAVARIVIHDGGETTVIPADHPSLIMGWWAAEFDNGEVRRWTNGDARVPLSCGPAVIEVHLAGTNTYVVSSPMDRPALKTKREAR